MPRQKQPIVSSSCLSLIGGEELSAHSRADSMRHLYRPKHNQIHAARGARSVRPMPLQVAVPTTPHPYLCQDSHHARLIDTWPVSSCDSSNLYRISTANGLPTREPEIELLFKVRGTLACV